MPPLQRFVVALTGGLQDSKAQPDPGDFVKLYNFSVFRGRFGVRAPVEQIQTIGSESSILDIKRHLDKVFILTWNSTNQDVDLYSMPFLDPDTGWGTETLESQIYTGVTTRPDINLTSFSGGSETLPQDRLYIADFTQANPTKFWIDDISTLTQLKEDLDANATAEDIYFSLMAPYQFHLWGTGFYGGTGTDYRPEMLRFSQPGLIPNIDPAGGVDQFGGTPASKQWFSFAYRNLGRRGDRIQALSYAAGNMMVFQAGSIHALFGYGQDSWAAKQVSDQVGCVGPRAVVQAGSGGLCYFWSHDGPFATDGTTLQPMGEDIRQHVVDLGADAKVTSAYAPDEGIIYYTLYRAGIDIDGTVWPEEYLAFDVNRNKWAEGSWLDGSMSDPFKLQISCLETLTPREISAAPGPIGAPSTLALAGFDQTYTNTTVNLTWVPGDTSTEVETVIHRSLTPAFSPGAGNEIARQPSGDAAAYSDTGRDGLTDYYYQVRHYRNGTYSTASNELSVRTPCPTLTDYIHCKTIPTGVRVTVEVPAGSVDVMLERSIYDSAGSSGWVEATTMSNPGSGTQTYDDTGGECYKRYNYRGTCQKATETDSEIVEDCPHYRGTTCRPVGACVEGSTLAFEVTAGTTTLTNPSGKRYTQVYATCTYLHASVGLDMIESAVDKGDGEGYVEAQLFPLSTADGSAYRTLFAHCPADDSTWTIRWRAMLGGTEAIDTASNTPSNPCTGVDI